MANSPKSSNKEKTSIMKKKTLKNLPKPSGNNHFQEHKQED